MSWIMSTQYNEVVLTSSYLICTCLSVQRILYQLRCVFTTILFWHNIINIYWYSIVGLGKRGGSVRGLISKQAQRELRTAVLSSSLPLTRLTLYVSLLYINIYARAFAQAYERKGRVFPIDTDYIYNPLIAIICKILSVRYKLSFMEPHFSGSYTCFLYAQADILYKYRTLL